jgi:hypothetical protein
MYLLNALIAQSVCGSSVHFHVGSISQNMRAIGKVTSSELLTKKATRKKIL